MEIAEEIGELELQGSAVRNMGFVYYFLGHYDQAEALFQKAIKLHEQMNDEWSVASEIGNLGLVCFAREEYDLAIGKYQQCLQILERYDAKGDQARTWHDMGDAYRVKGEVEESSACFEKAIQLFNEENNHTGKAESFALLGLLYYENNQLTRAAEYLEKGLKAIDKIYAPVQRRDLMSNLALVYIRLNRYLEAQILIEEAFKLLHEDSSEVDRAILLNNFGLLQRVTGEYESARKNFVQCYHIRKEYGLDRETETALYNLGVICYSEHRLNEAFQYLSESLQLCKKHDWKEREGATLAVLGLVYEKLGQFTVSLKCYEKSIELLKSFHDFEGIWSNYYNLGRLYEDSLSDIEKAQCAYEESVKYLMKVRQRMSVEHRAAYAEDKTDVFERMVTILISKGDLKNAFIYVEMSKARALTELLLDSRMEDTENLNSLWLTSFMKKEIKLEIE